jgi:molybdenum cofactor cytidylyltransferase
LKAPEEHEPVIPAWIRLVITTAGLLGIGRPLDEATVHRSELFSRLSGLQLGEMITPEGLARVLADPRGGLKGVSPSMGAVALLNQAETDEEIINGMRVANTVIKYQDKHSFFRSTLIASMSQQQVRRVIERTAVVILAAGGSSRLGQSKLLLTWHEQPLVRHITQTALASAMGEVIVVTGAADSDVRAALQDLPVNIVTNKDWQSGQSTSLRKGLQSIHADTGTVIFLLADQPYVSAELIQALNNRHQITLAPAVAPRVESRRANPVLFDRVTFPDLLKLEGDTGGRAILDRHAIEYVDWPDTRILLDIDTPEDWQHLREIE